MALCLRLVQFWCTAAFKICIKAVEMPAVGMWWQRRRPGRLEVPSPQQATTSGCFGLSAIAITGEKKRAKGAAKNGRGDGTIDRTEEKLLSCLLPRTGPWLPSWLAHLSLPPSVSLSSHSPCLGLRLPGQIFTKLRGLGVGNSGAS